MSSILKVSDAATIGMHAMACLAASGNGAPMSTNRIAQDLEVSEAHLSKVLQRLSRQGLVASKRGPGGGFLLGRSPSDIKLQEIYEAIEGPLPTGTCLLGRDHCPGGSCILGDMLRGVQDQVARYFSSATLESFRRWGGHVGDHRGDGPSNGGHT